MDEVPEYLRIDPRVASALGKSREEMADMDLREFFDLVHDKGFAIKVSSRSAGEDKGNLTVVIDSPPTGTNHPD